MAHFPATTSTDGILTAADKTQVDNSARQFLEGQIQTTPNEVINLYGDGSTTARGISFASERIMVRLRVSFKVDAGNNHDIRVRLRKFDGGTSTIFELAAIIRSNAIDGNPGSNTYHILEQLISAGANPAEASIISGDFIFVTIDKAAGTVATGVSQVTILTESEVV